jgi:hypothetical protein
VARARAGVNSFLDYIFTTGHLSETGTSEALFVNRRGFSRLSDRAESHMIRNLLMFG